MGFFITSGGLRWIPLDANEFIVWDGIADSWVTDDQPIGTQWGVTAYNLDTVYTHRIVVRLHVSLVSVAAAAAVPTLNIMSNPITQDVLLAG